MGHKVSNAELAARLKIVEPRVEELDRIIVRGNGKPSMQEDVRTILKYISDEQERRKWSSRLMFTLVMTNLIGLSIAAFAWFVKIYPVIEQLNQQGAGR
jgi:hypothetical protein